MNAQASYLDEIAAATRGPKLLYPARPNGRAHAKAVASTNSIQTGGTTDAPVSSEPDEPRITLASFDRAALLAPIEPERYLIPGKVPTEAYTLIAGGLSSAKTTLLHMLILWRATGYDFLDMTGEKSAGIDVGPCVLVSYEDSDKRIAARFQRLVQHQHSKIAATHGDMAATEYLDRVESNIRRVTLTGQSGAGIVIRADRWIFPNQSLIDELVGKVKAFASSGVMIGLDPLRLAIVGSQNEDDGADTVVHTLNAIACRLPDSGLVVPSHTTKSNAIEPGSGQAAAAYATSGSALYSQHARSNFHMARMKVEDIRRTFAPDALTEDEVQQQRVTQLTHARLSHGPESGRAYFVMREGVLEPIKPHTAGATGSVDDKARTYLPLLADAIQRLTADGHAPSGNALESDGKLGGRIKRHDLRQFIKLANEQGWLETTGSGPKRGLALTLAGRHLAGIVGEVG